MLKIICVLLFAAALAALPIFVVYFSAGMWYVGEVPWWIGLPGISLGLWLEHLAMFVIRGIHEKYAPDSVNL